MSCLLTRYPSTVFLCETNEDDRYVRCDFKHCREHPLNVEVSSIPVSYWYLNTRKNCNLLERHVTKEIQLFVNEHERKVTQFTVDDYELNINLIMDKEIQRQYKKVLIVFNLRSPQSSYGRWLDMFLKASEHNKSTPGHICLTFSFASRMEMLQKIEMLHKVNWDQNCEIMALLSCHSSSQGQVFSCTPTALTESYGFEEFCSIHDFVCSLQDVLKDKLKIVHISSCFALKLNQSHIDWPVDCLWIKDKLKCLLSGNAKEVYETGSQTADLYLVLRTFLSTEYNMQTTFKTILRNISLNLFPDLVLEMGLCLLEKDLLESMIENPEREDQITVPNTVVSSLHLVIICDIKDDASVLLKDGLLCNLKTRFEMDFETRYSMFENGVEDIRIGLDGLQNTQLFIVVLSEVNGLLVNNILRILEEQKKVLLYGIHFQSMRQLDGEFNESQTFVGNDPECQTFDLDVTACKTTSESSNYSETFSVLLYIVHLALGENGEKINTVSGETSISYWPLSDVYKEACNVLEGLCKICDLKLISRKLSRVDNPSNDSNTLQNTSVSSPIPVYKTSKLACDKITLSDSLREKENVDKSKIEDQQHEQHQPQQHQQIELRSVFDRELKDVPLMANVNEVLVYHYALHLDVDFDKHTINGRELLFLKPVNAEVGQKEFQMCLDCTLIDIVSVEEIILPENFKIHFHRDQCCCPGSTTCNGETEAGVDDNRSKSDPSLCPSCKFLQQSYDSDDNKELNTKDLNYKTLPYAVYGWCVRIWNTESSRRGSTSELSTIHHWPQCVRIHYETKPIGPSLTWCKDQDGNDCCYTPGAFINNRSMMPCQEPPVAVATWQATVNAPKSFTVISSGNLVKCKQKRLSNDNQNKDTFCFEMSIPLPSSTLAFAFGKFIRSSRSINVTIENTNQHIPVTMFAAPSLIQNFQDEYLELAAEYLQCTCQLLGSYPFTRLDLVVMPRSFACMGLKSPNMMFLSQSVLCGDRSMSTRIAHEISHAWFGLLVGTKDWTEEWLSEGFASYMEDRILAHHEVMTEQVFLDQSRLLQLLRLNVLKGELTQTEDDNLKLLRPKRKNYTSAVEAVNKNVKDDNNYVQPYQTVPNAAIASKKWSQVHYLKGYFLLVQMASTVGFQRFDAFLKSYVEQFEGQLVTSEMFFDFYTTHFKLPSETKNYLIKEWLESTDLPKGVLGINATSNVLVRQVDEEFAFWKNCNTVNKRCKSRGLKRKQNTFKTRSKLVNSNQTVLLLEKLLIIDEIVPETMTQLNMCYVFAQANVEIRHRWCELIIKHGCINRHNEVKRFLIEDQGMGIYLFGELVIWGRSKQKKMAYEIFEYLRDEMDKSTKETVADLVHEK